VGNNGSLEQLEVAMKQALSPSSGAANFLPAHGSLHSQVGWPNQGSHSLLSGAYNVRNSM
jgi:hypothetical protein